MLYHERHHERNCNLWQESASTRDKHNRMYLHVSDRPKSGTPIVMIALDRDHIVGNPVKLYVILLKGDDILADQVAREWSIVIISHPNAINRT